MWKKMGRKFVNENAIRFKQICIKYEYEMYRSNGKNMLTIDINVSKMEDWC